LRAPIDLLGGLIGVHDSESPDDRQNEPANNGASEQAGEKSSYPETETFANLAVVKLT
jgi:hypothetical protein